MAEKPDRLAQLGERVDLLESESEIRSLIGQYGRAIDRNDPALLASLFFPDADVHYGSDVFEGKAGDYVPALLGVQASMVGTHHLLGQSLIKIVGDSAWAETYSQAIHIIAQDQGLVEFASGGRYLDRFERRGGNGGSPCARLSLTGCARSRPMMACSTA